LLLGFYEIVTRKEAERRLERTTRPLPDREKLLQKLKELNVEVQSLKDADDDDQDGDRK